MELDVSKFDYKKLIQVVHVKCRDSDIILDSKTFRTKISVEVADCKRQIFEVMVTKDNWYDHVRYYQLSDSGKVLFLYKTKYRSRILFPKYGIILRWNQNIVTICDVETLKQLDTLQFEEEIITIRTDSEYLFIFFEAKTIVINYGTNQRYIFDLKDKHNVKDFIKNLKKAPYLLRFEDLLDKNWTSSDDLITHASKCMDQMKLVIPFSEHYMSEVRNNLLMYLAPDLVFSILVPFLGF